MSIKTIRKEAGLTQEELAKITEIPIDTIKGWESNRRTPKPWLEKLIAYKINNTKKEQKSS